MSSEQPNSPGPDLTNGISVNDFADGHMLLGHVDKDPVLLARRGDEFGFEDVTGIPWIEIDFPEDVERARRSILPRLSE